MQTRYENLSDQQKREIRMYGCMVDQMKEAVENGITFKLTGPAMVVASMMSDAQEMLEFSHDSMVSEDIRQLLNRAKWVLSNYMMEK